MIDTSKLSDIEIDNVKMSDYPDFCDAYISAAIIEENGIWRDLTEEELNELNDEYPEFVYQKAVKSIF